MSMTAVTAWQIVQVFVQYTVLVLTLPNIVFRGLLRRRSFSGQLIFSLVVGNLWIITAVQLLLLVNIANPFTLLASTYGAALVIYCCTHGAKTRQAFAKFGDLFVLIMNGELRGKLLLDRSLHGCRLRIREGARHIGAFLWRHRVLVLAYLGCMGVAMWNASHQALYKYNFGTSDVVVHISWINAMLQGKLFYAGIYPYGYHAIIYFMVELGGPATAMIMRVMGVVQSFYIFTFLFITLLRLCRNRYAAIFGFLIFCVSGAFSDNSFMRYQWSLPQEYAMLFLYPGAMYLTDYLQGDKTSRFSLILFGVCFSLTLSVHFYITIVLGLLSLAVMLAHLPGCLSPRRLLPLALSVTLGVLLALFPMGIAYWQGTPPEASLQWAQNIISKGHEDAPSDTTEESLIEVSASSEASGKTNGFTRASLEFLISSVTPAPWFYFSVGTWMLSLICSLIGLAIPKARAYSRRYLSIGIYELMLVAITAYPGLGYPALMEGSRSCIFICYALCLSYTYPIELVSAFLGLWRYSRRLCGAWALAASAALMSVIYLPSAANLGFTSHVMPSYFSFQYPQVITLLYDLNRNYPAGEWTLVSTLMETQLVYPNGWHYDLYTFLDKQRNWTPDTRFTIPTKYIFLYTEKKALKYPENIDQLTGVITSTDISEEYAAQALPSQRKTKLVSIYSDYRTMLMSKAYAWAQEALKLYPFEMSVYSETDEAICYKITQDPSTPLNLGLDYGYNHRNEVITHD